MTRDLEDSDCRKALAGCQSVLLRLQRIEEMLRLSSSFLDRIEEVGITATTEACMYGLVGPVARAAGVGQDLRKVQPYCGYGDLSFEVPVEEQGDGYARLRILFAEARQSVRLIEQSVEALPTGPVNVPLEFRSGSALGWVEAPRGAAVIWLQVDNKGKVQRYRVMPPSFINWHGFHLAAENFAFQDFPIILATFDLSVAENDR